MDPDLDVVEIVRLPPAARSTASLGHTHSLESAIADLIDNSIDAGATDVAVRFLQDHGRTTALQVGDNGRGMTSEVLKESMRLGTERDYSDQSLGHFGVGLKVASLSQATELLVVSRPVNAPYSGARIRADAFQVDYSVDILQPQSAAAVFAATRTWAAGSGGTIVQWNGIRSVLGSGTLRDHETWVHDTIEKLAVYLGIVYHRLLARSRVSIEISVLDRSTRAGGVPRRVTAFDPFSYRTSGDPDFPIVLEGKLETGTRVELGCHILPAHGESANFRLMNRPGADWQGLYFYRHDRLIQIGGWSQVTIANPKLQLARVEVEVTSALIEHVGMSAEKNSAVLSAALIAAIRSAEDSDGGLTFDDYQLRARQVFSNSRKRRFKRKPLFPLGSGFDPVLSESMSEAVGVLPGASPVNIVWTRLPSDRMFELDRAGMTIHLNDEYRPLLAPTMPGRSSGDDDAPLMKVLLFLLVQDHFAGSRLGPKERDDVEVWNLAMKVAADQIAQNTQGGVYDN